MYKLRLTILAVLLLTMFTSCKKDWVCKCKVTYTYQGNASTFDETRTIYNSTKSQAKANCFDYELSSPYEKYEYDCKLK